MTILIALAIGLTPTLFVFALCLALACRRSHDPGWAEVERRKNEEEAAALRFMELTKVK